MSFVGRDQDLEHIWTLLAQRSVLLTGPRRVGKTELLFQLEQRPRHGWRVVRVDLQGVTSISEAVGAIIHELDAAQLGEAQWKRLMEKVEGVGAAGLHLKTRESSTEQGPWHQLDQAMDQAVNLIEDTQSILLCLDEVPWWLDDVRRTSGPESARQALARLRALRQHHPQLRMILTGSVGLSGLANQLGASADINDVMPSLPLRPLDVDAGATLFETEVMARGATADGDTSRHAHRLAGGFPHWIKMLAERAPIAAGRIAIEDVDAAGQVLLSVRNRSLFNDEGAEHFDRRYPADRIRRLHAVLDTVSREEGPASKDLLITAALHNGAQTRKDAWDDIMELVDAWMLDSADDESFYFLLPLFRLWWQKYGGAP